MLQLDQITDYVSTQALADTLGTAGQENRTKRKFVICHLSFVIAPQARAQSVALDFILEGPPADS
jgi:hypothetical protein